jgi:low temperature requirement protein LtrA
MWASGGHERFTPVRRHDERVMPLELFFDLVFVLAITQCTGAMADDPTWAGVGESLLVLAVLWWSWVGYAWLTSVLDPEEGAVRLTMVAAMAALLVAALAVPDAIDDLGVTLAVAYGAVRVAHLGVFVLASREDAALRSSVAGLAGGTAVGVALLVAGALVDGEAARAGLWGLALLLDMAEPFFFGSEGWQLEPAHFVERHGLIIIIALGESIVAIGIGAEHDVDAGVLAAAVAGVVLVAALWWAYFDVVSTMAGRRLLESDVGRQQNELARDAYSYLHFPLVAGIVLVAFGLKTTIADVDRPLDTVTAVAMCGGAALYLLGHVAFAARSFGAVKIHRLVTAAASLALIPLALEVDAIVTLVALASVLSALIVYETVRYAEAREQIRHSTPEG